MKTKKKKTTRGFANCNPLYIKHTPIVWPGMREKQTDKLYVQFKDFMWGYYAMFMLIRFGIEYEGLNTIEKMLFQLNIYTDAKERKDFINLFSVILGKRKNEVLDFYDERSMTYLMQLFTMMFNRRMGSYQDIQKAYKMASIK